MSLSGAHKRFLDGTIVYQNQSFNSRKETNYHNDSKYRIIAQTQSQNGIRGQLVLFQSSFESAYMVLQNATDRISAILKVYKTEEYKENSRYRLEINNEVLAEDTYKSLSAAKTGLAELAIEDLRKSCFTVFRKTHPRDSPKIDLASPNHIINSAQDTFKTNNVKGIGAKMMLSMGWSGSGLGAYEQGTTDLIKPYIQIQHQGLGTKRIVQEVTGILRNYALSKDINSIAFSSDFSKEERAVIHVVARKLNLKSRSYGHESNRVLVVKSKIKVWDLIRLLLDVGGENDQYKLILPVNHDGCKTSSY
ncbi:hypothetical protein ILUMI_06336 [Ignelater luminosus]|uniref:Uncharacterized protein n=1 Tax=Ignelater luminosus TaxID=2038154 RepID=A0A8K0GHB4_IGNLU|nr:hypothetical protein ILUMI_06336 [Ignelater luminosus]